MVARRLPTTNDHRPTTVSFLSILNRLPKSDPHIEHAQASRNAAREAAGYYGAKRGVREEQRVVGPLGAPGQNHKHHPKRRAQEHEQKDSDAAEPQTRGRRRAPP